MADLKRTIDLVFKGTDETGAATRAALDNAQKFSSSLGSVTAPIADFTGNALKFEAALLGAGAAVTAFAIKVAADFETAATDLNKVLGDTENIEEYKDLAVALSTEYGVAAVEVLDSITSFKQAGFTAEEAGLLTKNALDLVIAGGINAKEGSDLLVASLKGLGLEAGRSTEIIDLLNEVSNNFAASTGQLLEGLSTLSPVARTAGFSLQETIAVLTPGIEVFQSGTEVANALRTVFLNLVSDTDRVTDSLDLLGVSQTDVNGTLRSGRDIFFDVAQEVSQLDQNQQLLFANQLVGKNRAAEFLAVINGLPTTLNIASESFEFAGSAAGEVALQLETANVQADRAKQSFTNLLNVIGRPLLDAYGDVAGGLAAIFEALGVAVNDENGGVAELIGFIESQLDSLAETLEQVAKNVPEAFKVADLTGFQEGLQSVSEAIGGLFDEFDLDTPQGLASAIEGIADAFKVLSEFTAGVIESFEWIFDAIANNSGDVLEIAERFARLGGNIGGIATQVNAILPAVENLVAILSALAGVMTAKAGIGIVGSASAAGLSLKSLAVTLGPAGAVALAAGFAIAQISRVVNALGELGDANRRAELAEIEATVATNARNREFERLSNRLGITITDQGQLNSLIEDGTLRYSELTGLIVRTTDAWRENQERGKDTFSAITDEGERTEAQLDALRQALLDSGLTPEQVGLVKTLDEVGDSAEGAEEKTERWIETTVDGVRTFTQVGGGVVSSLGDVDTALDDITQSSEEFRTRLREIASEEYIATLEAKTEFDIANLEEETKRIEKAFESIDNTITSTGELLGELFDAFTSTTGLDQLFVQREIERESERRDNALKLQERLTNAQIDALRERTRQMANGQALLTVDGAGLQPHLEAFMWEILRTIQVRVNEDGLDMLLGAT